jgi:hypothetical protein
MGVRLGMSIVSLNRLLERLQNVGMRSQRYIVYPELISETLSEDLVSNLPGSRFRHGSKTPVFG